MQWSKSAISSIFQKSADWLDWSCPVGAALKNCSMIFLFFSFLYFNFHLFFRYETVVRSSALSFGDSDPDPSSVILNQSSFYRKYEKMQKEAFTSGCFKSETKVLCT